MLRKKSRLINSLTDAANVREAEVDAKFLELQENKMLLDNRYQEGKLFEAMSVLLQGSESLGEVIRTALNELDTKFGLKRSIVLLHEKETGLLSFAGCHGLGDAQSQLEGLKIDVQVKRENPVVASTVFHTQQSVLIPDLSLVKGLFNETSKNLFEALQTSGFIMVSIPGREGSQGIVIADSGTNCLLLGREQQTLLERVAKLLGTFFDKERRIQREISIRSTLEKYVPNAQLLNSFRGPELGGVYRNVSCIFLDIVGFTSLSEKLHPAMTVSFVNLIFSFVDRIVSEQKGEIDKFTGDGAMIVWGLHDNKMSSRAALEAAFKLLNGLPDLNMNLKSQGYPEVKVRIGLTSGEAIVGNIGSNRRMNFTCMGSCINLSARLEALCKDYNAAFAVTLSELEETFGTEIEELMILKVFEIKRGVHLRGMSEQMDIAVMLNYDSRVLKLFGKHDEQKLAENSGYNQVGSDDFSRNVA